MIVWSLMALLLVVIAINEIYTFRTGVPTISSFPASRKAIVKALLKYDGKNGVPPLRTIIDLGSGNGRLARQIAAALRQTDILGIEISFIPVMTAHLRQRLFGPKNLAFKKLDFWPYDISNVDAVVAYVNGAIIERVSNKLRKELKPGALVITNEIPLMGDWQPIEVIETNFLKMKVFVYQMPV